MNKSYIHITWKNSELNEQQLYILNKWKELHKIEVKFWTDDDNTKFVDEFYPQYKIYINALKKMIQKIDFLRCLYLYHFGGIYTDIDLLPLKNFDCFLKLNKIVLFFESDKNAKLFNLNKIISNSIMISPIKHPFILEYINTMCANSKLENQDPLYSTGPFCLNKVYDKYVNKEEVLLLRDIYTQPLTLSDINRKSNEVQNMCKFSYGVHLYEGTWWIDNPSDKNDLIKKIESNHIKKFPLISCLCITKNDIKLLMKAVECFNNQIYPNRELIIIYEDNNQFIEQIEQLKNLENIKLLKIDSKPKKTLGELRNMSIEMSNGKYICQWDDDDYYCPTRIYEQYINMISNNKSGCILDQWIIHDFITNNIYLSNKRVCEGSILVDKKLMKTNSYPQMSIAEDTPLINKIIGDLSIMHMPDIYIYNVHTNNTWNRQHFLDIFRCSALLSPSDPRYYYKYLNINNENKSNNEKKMNPKIPYPIYYVNLDRSNDRKKYMEESFSNHGIENYKRISAIDGKHLTNLKGGVLNGIKFINKCMNLGTFCQVAVCLSHIKAILQAYNDGVEYAVIMEDDIVLDLMPKWELSISDIINHCPNMNIIQLFTSSLPIYNQLLQSNALLHKKPRGVNNIYFYGAVCYIISRKGMEELLKRTYIKDSDLIVLEWFHVVTDGLLYDMDESYIFSKPLFYTNDEKFKSTIDDINSNVVVPGTDNVKALDNNGSNGYGLTIGKEIQKYYNNKKVSDKN